MKTCETCGEQADPGARQCHRCSNWFDEATWVQSAGLTCNICGESFDTVRGVGIHKRVHR